MYNERPSTTRIVMTIVGWGVGFLVLAAAVVGVAWLLTPKTGSTPLPPAESTATPAATSTAPATTTPSVQPTAPVSPAPALPSTSTTPAQSERPLTGRVVAIDAGHQLHGDNSLEPIGPGSKIKKPKVATGTSGVKTHQSESSVNLAVALKLRDELLSEGARVVMIRTTQNVNISNSRRAKMANAAHANLFIRLHCDGSTDHTRVGLSTLVPKSNSWTKAIVQESSRAGGFVERAAVAASGAKNLGVTTRGDLSGFNWSTVPTVLVEMGFLTNAEEDQKLATSAYQTRLADGLADGVTGYLRSL